MHSELGVVTTKQRRGNDSGVHMKKIVGNDSAKSVDIPMQRVIQQLKRGYRYNVKNTIRFWLEIIREVLQDELITKMGDYSLLKHGHTHPSSKY